MTGGQRLAAGALWTAALLFALLTAGGILGFDAEIARRTAMLPRDGSFWSEATALLDALALRGVSDFLLGATLIVAAILLVLLRATRETGVALLYVGAVQFVATAVATVAAPLLGRLRPHETAGDLWFAAGGTSFPSLDVAFHAGLFLPLAALLPRLSPLFILPLLLVSAARVLEHDAYLSDVCASVAVAAALAALLNFLVRGSRA